MIQRKTRINTNKGVYAQQIAFGVFQLQFFRLITLQRFLFITKIINLATLLSESL